MQKVVEKFEEVEVSSHWQERGQVKMADEANLRSPICSTFEALIVQRTVSNRRREELGPVC